MYNINQRDKTIFDFFLVVLFILYTAAAIFLGSVLQIHYDEKVIEIYDKNPDELVVSLPQQNYLPVAGNRDPTETNVDKAEVINLIIHYSKIYGVDQETALRIATCESGLRSGAKNPRSSAAGVFQITRPTFDEAAQRMGKSWRYDNGGVYIPAVNIEVATWLLSRGESYRWVCR